MRTILLLAALSILGHAGGCVDIRALYTPQYDECVKQAKGTADRLACLDVEFQRQDERLNAAYKTTRKSLEPSRRKALRDLQRAWIAYRDAKCGFYHHKHAGSGGLMDAAQCLVDETIRRTLELRFETY